MMILLVVIMILNFNIFKTSFAEIEALRARVMEKEKEVEDVRRSSLAPFRR
jgi:predicted Holliday junction resolvase-like endonuclease